MADACQVDLQIVEFLTSDATMQLRHQVESGAAAVGSWAAGIAAAGVSAYSIIWVLNFARGGSGGSVSDLIWWWARAMVFATVAGTASYYSAFVTDTFWTAPSQLAQVVAVGSFNPADIRMDNEGQIQMGTALDLAANRGFCNATNLWKATSSWDPIDGIGFFLMGLLLIAAVVIFIAIAAGLIFIGYVSLGIVTSLGPLFIIAGIWDTTKPMFESFIRTATNYALYGVVVMMIVGITLGLITAFSNSALGAATSGMAISEAIVLAVRTAIVFAIAVAMLLKADDISASLVGGISLGAGHTLKAAAKGATLPVKAATAAGRFAQNPAKGVGQFLGGDFHRDMRSGKMVYRSASQSANEHGAALANARKKNSVKKT